MATGCPSIDWSFSWSSGQNGVEAVSPIFVQMARDGISPDFFRLELGPDRFASLTACGPAYQGYVMAFEKLESELDRMIRAELTPRDPFDTGEGFQSHDRKA